MSHRKYRKKVLFPFLEYGRDVAVFYGLVVIASYFLAGSFFPSMINLETNKDFFQQTFLVFLVLSIPLSLTLLFIRSTYAASLLLLFRFYLIMIQGYGLGGYFTLKLILGIPLLVEAGLLLKKPFNWIFSTFFTLGLVFSQIYNPILGHNQLFGGEIYASMDTLLILLFIFGTVACCISLMVRQAVRREDMLRDLNIQRESMKALAEFNANLQGYARTIGEESSDRERHRISREIHDISGYIFTNLIALLNAACSIPKEDQESLSDILITARKQAQEGLKETRTALRKTREQPVPEEEGIRAINKIILIFRKVTGVQVDVNWGNMPNSFSREINFVLYRTIQEALTNAFRHGMATKITIHFLVEKGVLYLTVLDNGRGAETVVNGIGLAGMEERVGNLGGTLSAGNAPGGGFSLKVRIPLEENRSFRIVFS